MANLLKPSVYFYLGVVAVIGGFVCLRTPPVNGVWTLTIAPLLLVLGYVVLVPMGLWPREGSGSSRNRRRYIDKAFTAANLVGLGVFASSLIVYLLTLWPAPGWWVSSDYVTCSYMLGVTSPPGSVLLQLLGRLASFVPFIASPAVRTNVLVAVITALSVTVVYCTVVRLCRSFDNARKNATRTSMVAGVLAALTLAFAHSVWSHATFTNPYALSLLTGSLLVYLAVRWWENPGSAGAGNFLLLAAFLFGLDFSVHRSNLLLAPAFFLLVLLRKPRALLDWRLWGGGTVLFVIGLSLQLFVMFRAQLGPQINIGNPDSWRGLWDYLTLSQFGIKTFGSDLLQRKGPFWSYQIKEMYLRYLGWNFIGVDSQGVGVRWTGLWGVPIIVGIVGFIFHTIRRPRQALFLMAAFLLVSLGAIFYLNVPAGFFREMDRHFLVSFMLVAVWIGFGSYAILKVVPRLLVSRPHFSSRAAPVLVGILFLALPVNLLRANWNINDMSNNYTSYAYGYNLLQSCEPNAILITAGDNDTFMPWYLQIVEGVRPDVVVLNAPLLNTAWFLNTTMVYQPDLPWSLTEDSLENLNVVPWETDTITIAGRGSDSVSCSLVVEPSIADKYLLIQDQVLLNILRQNRWQRPLYFSIGFGERLPLELQEYARPDGLVWRIVPKVDERVDYRRLEDNLLYRYNYDGFGRQTFLDRSGRWGASSYQAAFARLAGVYRQEGRPEKLELLKAKLEELWPDAGALVARMTGN